MASNLITKFARRIERYFQGFGASSWYRPNAADSGKNHIDDPSFFDEQTIYKGEHITDLDRGKLYANDGAEILTLNAPDQILSGLNLKQPGGTQTTPPFAGALTPLSLTVSSGSFRIKGRTYFWVSNEDANPGQSDFVVAANPDSCNGRIDIITIRGDYPSLVSNTNAYLWSDKEFTGQIYVRSGTLANGGLGPTDNAVGNNIIDNILNGSVNPSSDIYPEISDDELLLGIVLVPPGYGTSGLDPHCLRPISVANRFNTLVPGYDNVLADEHIFEVPRITVQKLIQDKLNNSPYYVPDYELNGYANEFLIANQLLHDVAGLGIYQVLETHYSQTLSDSNNGLNPFRGGCVSGQQIQILTGVLAGSGNLNYVAKWIAGTTLGNSSIQDDASNVSVNGALALAYKFAVYSATGTYCIYGNTTSNGGAGIAGVNQGVGASTNYGAIGTAQNSTSLNVGVYGQAAGASTENIGGHFTASGATTNYSIQLQDGTEGIGNVLTSITADGKAQWVALSTIAVTAVTGTAPIVSTGGATPDISIPLADASTDGYLSATDWTNFNAKVGGSGTTNYVARWTPSGTTLGDSLIQDNGSNIAVNGSILSAYKFAVYSTTPGENYNIYGNTTVNGAVGVGGVNQGVGASTNYGATGEAQNSTSLNIGVYGQAIGASTENVGGKFSATLATSNYAVQLQDGTEGAGKVLTSMTADGKAQWVAQTVAAGIIYITNQTTGAITYYSTLELASAGAVSGDTIYVNPGTYNVTTTATNGLFKDGVNWMFAPKAAVTKSTAGDMFNDTGATLGGSIYGNGVFTTSGSAGLVFNNVVASLLLLYTIEAHSATSSSNSVFKTTGASFNFKVPYCTSTAGFCMFMAQSNLGSVSINVDCIKWRSTANSVFGNTWWYTTLLNVKGNVLESTVGAAINSINSNNRIVLDVNQIIGVTYGISQGDGISVFMSLNCSYITGIYCVGSRVNLNGFCGNININGNDSSLVGGECEYITVNGGYVKTVQVYLVDPAPLVTVTGGTLDINFSRLGYGITFNVTGGIMNILSSVTAGQISDLSGRVINGGEVNVYSKFIHGGNPDYASFDTFTLQAGILRLLAPVQNNFNVGSSNYSAHGVVWSGGKLIVDRCAINIADTLALPIQATTAGLNLKVLSGGLSTNITADGGVLLGKKMKYKFTISAIAATGINILIPLSYNISESNTGVYNTKALLAQRMASLINGSPFLNVAVIATQDTPGTDEYFYIETLTAGPVFSYNTPVNFSAINIQRWNSYAITNITGGSILENINVE